MNWVLKNVDTNIPICYKSGLASGNNSVVECDLAKVEVAGSNPVSRSKMNPGLAQKASPFSRLFYSCLYYRVREKRFDSLPSQDKYPTFQLATYFLPTNIKCQV